MDARPDTFTIEELLTHERWAERLALALVGDPAGARDVLQETWIAALERPPMRDRPARGWLATVLRNFAAQRRRAERRRRLREERVARIERLPPSDELAQRLDGQRILTERVMALPEIFRDTVVLHYYEGLALAEIARRGGEPAATVRGRLRRALQLLRESFVEREEGKRGESLLALAPLVRRARTAQAAAATPTLLASPALLLVLTAGLGAAVIFGWRIGTRESAPEPTTFHAADAGDSRTSADPLSAPGTTPSRRPAEAGRRFALDRDRDPAAPEAVAPHRGWWLLGAVPGWEEAGAAPATLTIRRERDQGAGAPRAVLAPDGRVRVDLGPLFTDEVFLPRRLHVTLTHPALLDHEQYLEVSRVDRQSGFHPDGLATWTLDGAWTAAPFAVEGTVRVAPGSGARRVIVALFACDERGDPAAPPVSIRTLAPGDAASEPFRLPAASPGDHLVVATAIDEGGSAAHAGALPVTRRVVVVDGEHPNLGSIELAPGASFDGRLECAGVVGARCRLRFADADRSARGEITLVPGVALSWNGSRFIHRVVETVTDDTGRFAVGALEPGAALVRLLGPTNAAGEAVPTVRVDVDPPALRVDARATGVTLDFDIGCTLLHVTRGGLPVFGAHVPEGSREHSREDGLLGVLRPPAHALELIVRDPGREGTALRLAPPGREAARVAVELPDLVPPARLELDVLGDSERTIEVMTVELRRAAEPGAVVTRRRTRRLAGPLVLSDLPPGRYVVRAEPADYGTGDAAAGTILPCTMELELTAGATARRSLVLERGGSLRIPAGTLPASGDRLSFRVLDREGAVQEVELVSDDDPATYRFLPVDRDVRTAPALPAGLYELEVRDGAGAPRTLPFELRAGAETVLMAR